MINTRKLIKYFEIVMLAISVASFIAAIDSYLHFRNHTDKSAIDAYFSLIHLGLYKFDIVMALLAAGFAAVLHLLRINREEQINKPQ